MEITNTITVDSSNQDKLTELRQQLVVSLKQLRDLQTNFRLEVLSELADSVTKESIQQSRLQHETTLAPLIKRHQQLLDHYLQLYSQITHCISTMATTNLYEVESAADAGTSAITPAVTSEANLASRPSCYAVFTSESQAQQLVELLQPFKQRPLKVNCRAFDIKDEDNLIDLPIEYYLLQSV